MKSANLVCIAGPLAGQRFAVADRRLVFGREASCDFVLSDGSVSRLHSAVVLDSSGQIVVEDLDSRNGTFVNGIPIHATTLAPGDELRLGRSVFLLEDPSGSANPTPSSVSHRTVAQTADMRWLSRADRLRDENAGRSARELEALLTISTALQSERSVQTVARRLLPALQTALNAQKSAVILYWDGIECPPESIGDAPDFDTALCRSVIAEERAAAWEDQLAAPVVGAGKPFGILYAEGVRFDSAHLRLASAAGAIAGLALEAARHIDEAQAENQRLRRQLEARHNMVGDCEPMQAVYRFVARVAPLASTVLILGESGTGKELVAQALHRNSKRADKPFVAINCASLSENLLESELFGHEKGAFTGAVAQKRGKLEIASGGTVFLDELGEMPPATQAKLLRVLQQREMERLGGTRTIPLDIRVIAATNVDLEQAVKERRFREDLYYRLNVVTLEMPPLRKRRDDIVLLASYFIAQFSQQAGRRVDGLSPEARMCLLRYEWPGNVRELQNAMERAVVMGVADQVLPEDLPEALLERALPASSGGGELGYQDALNETKKKLIRAALEASGGNVTVAAQRLRLHPNYLHRLMSNLELR